MSATEFTAVFLIPTGIGAAMGGYAGDAIPIVRAMAEVCDRIITHPNVLNGAQLYWPLPSTLYVEGYALDQFAAGHWGLQPVRHNRVGLLLDQSIEPELRQRHLQAADATRATLGLSVTDVVVTDAPLGVSLQTSGSGATWGHLQNPDSLLRAAEQLLALGAEAIAVVARFPDDIENIALQNYRQGQGVDPLAGAEAVISHLIVRTFQVPCAHAPALEPLPLDPTLNPRAAAEELGYTFLPSVLVGLSRAPHLVQTRQGNDIWAEAVDAIVVPDTACGGPAVLSLTQAAVPVITVLDNLTTLNVTPDSLGVSALRVRSYPEAIGILAALKAGININTLQTQLKALSLLD